MNNWFEAEPINQVLAFSNIVKLAKIVIKKAEIMTQKILVGHESFRVSKIFSFLIEV
jgi:hypothetical protein